MIGSNFIADEFVAAAKHCSGLLLETAYSRREETAKINRDKWGFRKACWDFQELASDSNVDAVYIASPNSCHYAQVEELLRAGKHVLCEKPLVPCSQELSPLLHLAQKQGVLLLEAMRPAHLPAIKVIEDLLPKLGTLRYAEFSYAKYSSRYDSFRQGIIENAFDPTLSNGALMDLGVYCVHWMMILFGKPRRILSLASFIDDSIDTHGSALCDYGPFHVHLRYSKVHQGEQPAVIEGENGYLEIEPLPVPTHLKLSLRNGETTLIPLHMHTLDMRYEITRFMEMAADPALAQPYQRWTALSLQVMDVIREQNGIDFTKKKH